MGVFAVVLALGQQVQLQPVLGLQVENLLNIIPGENVVIAFDAFIKPKPL